MHLHLLLTESAQLDCKKIYMTLYGIAGVMQSTTKQFARESAKNLICHYSRGWCPYCNSAWCMKDHTIIL